MTKVITRIFLTFIAILFSSTLLAQQNAIVIDGFSDHNMTGWYSGGNVSMKYSHEQDNAENGFAEVLTDGMKITPNSFVGLIRKDQKFQVVQDNILSIMLQGTGNDLSASVQLLFDKNNDGKYDENSDTRLESKIIPLNFSGWKEIHINLNDNEWKVISKNNADDFSVLENEAIGFQLSYLAGKDYKAAKVETGIALVSERPNKEVKQELSNSDTKSNEESVFNLKNYPNPFNPETNISYSLGRATNVKITVYDRLGREITVLFDGAQSEGEHTVSFNASSLPSGIYFYRLKTSEKTEVRKMVLAK